MKTLQKTSLLLLFGGRIISSQIIGQPKVKHPHNLESKTFLFPKADISRNSECLIHRQLVQLLQNSPIKSRLHKSSFHLSSNRNIPSLQELKKGIATPFCQ